MTTPDKPSPYSSDPDRPQGLDPERLLAMGQSPQSGVIYTGRAGFVPPSVAEVAAAFPDLEVVGLIGRGGMGAVYKAVQRKLDRFVALKIMPPEAAVDEAFAERFSREARALAQLNHPRIVSVYDFGESGGFFFLMMEFIDGMNLREMLAMGQLSAREVLDIVPQICDALQFAHDAGIVHRDIKPENILIDNRGQVHIADFGLAKILGNAADPLPLTQTHQIVGTPHYMAPEQIERPAHVDHRADIFSLGVVFYEMLTGQLPLGRFEPPSARAPIADGFDDVVMRTLEREPAQRYQAAREMKSDVESLGHASTSGVSARGRRDSATIADTSRLSKLALFGFLWLMLSITVAPLMVYVILGDGTSAKASGAFTSESSPAEFAEEMQNRTSQALPWIFLMLMFGVSTLLGPILGAVAIPRIRHSAGQLHGMGLAVFTALCIPLMIPNLVVTKVLSEIGSPDVRVIVMTFVLLGLLVLDIWFLVWFTRRMSRTPVGAERA